MVNQTRKITEGAMMVAIVGVMLFINRQFANAIEFFMYWILTFPILIYTAKYGIKDGLLPSVSMLLISFMISAPTTIFYLFCCVVVGLVYGHGVRKKWKNGTLLISTGVVTLFSYIITTVVFGAIFGYDPSEDVTMVKTLLSIFDMEIVGVSLQNMVTMIVVLMAVLMSALQTICIHLLGNILLKRLKIDRREMNSIFDLQVPRITGVIIIVIWILFLSRNVLKLNQAVVSVILIVYLCAFIFAIGYGTLTCMIFCIIQKKRWLVFLVMIGALLPYVQQVIACIGIADMIWMLRKKIKRGVIYGQIRKL
ncbi:MAG: DUF2232 domain-containing protein [Longicatena sp.]